MLFLYVVPGLMSSCGLWLVVLLLVGKDFLWFFFVDVVVVVFFFSLSLGTLVLALFVMVTTSAFYFVILFKISWAVMQFASAQQESLVMSISALSCSVGLSRSDLALSTSSALRCLHHQVFVRFLQLSTLLLCTLLGLLARSSLHPPTPVSSFSRDHAIGRT
jgi:hypothetical protein